MAPPPRVSLRAGLVPALRSSPVDQRFPAAYRLKRRALIRSLFDRSDERVRTVAAGCVRIVFRTATREEVGATVPLQIGFAPGRRARLAVQRNRIKRLLRETYRRHQHPLVDLFSRRTDTLLCMVLFRGDVEEAARCLPRDLPRALRRLREAFPEATAKG